MEFFDFTGTNEEEKAQVLDIIANPSEAVEFFIDPVSSNQHQSGDNYDNIKSYSHLNGNVANQDIYENGAILIDNQANIYSQDVELESTDQRTHSNWDLANNSSGNSVVIATSIPFPPNGASAPVVCASPQFIFPSNANTYYAGPHSPMYAPMHPSMAMPPPHSVTSIVNQNHAAKDLKARMPSNSHIASSSAGMKNSSKMATPNCDIRNSFYPPPNQYSETRMLDTNRLPPTIMPVSADNGAVLGDPNAMVTSNGSSVVSHMGHHHQQHPAYTYAFPHTAALFPPGPFTAPVYFFTPEGSLFQYAPFATTPVPTHISTLQQQQPPHTHHQNVMTTLPSANDLQGSNQISSNIITSAHSSATATLSNLSSSISASSTSIAAAYHSSQSSQSGTPTSFELVEESNMYSNQNNTTVCDSKYNENNSEHIDDNNCVNSQLNVDLKEHVPSNDNKVVSQNNIVGHETSSTETAVYQNTFPTLQNEPIGENTHKSDDENSNSNAVNKFFSKLTSLHISKNENVQSMQYAHPSTQSVSKEYSPETVQKPDNTEEFSSLSDLPQNVYVDNNDVSKSQSDSNKETCSTWASKLFGSVNNVEACQIKSVKTENYNEEAKFTLSNGDSAIHASKTQSTGNYNRNNRFNFDDSSKLKVVSVNEDPIAFKLAKRLRDSIHLKHSLPTIMPCGLINRGNWCYVNATLQALLACPPFYNLMREIGETPGLFRPATSTPIIDNFARYFLKFLPSDFKRQLKSAGSSMNSYLEELLNSDPIEPISIYDTLNHIGMIKNDAQRGHQEDAEEFLSSVLNGINEEMAKLAKLIREDLSDLKVNGNPNDDSSLNKGNRSDSDENIWRLVGNPKYKSLPMRSTTVENTAITEIFGGSRLDIRTVNEKDYSAYKQSFFTLQLDIKPQSIATLEDAIRWQNRSQTIQDYTCSKTKQLVDARSQMFIETLPSILILHLKLFEYDIETGAERKLLKRIDFSENFEIPRECISSKDNRICKRFKLLAVVYHSGPEAVKGHYITDVYHLGLNQWLRCDDSTIKVISINKVLSGNSGEGNLVPYLLFYRRHDTLYSGTASTTSAAGNITSVTTNASGASVKYRSSSHEYAINQQQSHIHYNNTNNSQSQQQQHQQHNEVINTSNKYSSISRHF